MNRELEDLEGRFSRVVASFERQAVEQRERIAMAQEALRQISQDMQTVARAHQMIRGRLGSVEHAEADGKQANIPAANRFAGLSIRQMLRLIGDENGGQINSSVAGDTLVEAGVFADRRAAAERIYPVLSRHRETFQRVSRGVYRLAGESAEPDRSEAVESLA